MATADHPRIVKHSFFITDCILSYFDLALICGVVGRPSDKGNARAASNNVVERRLQIHGAPRMKIRGIQWCHVKHEGSCGMVLDQKEKVQASTNQYVIAERHCCQCQSSVTVCGWRMPFRDFGLKSQLL
jgi:hypothetical protein